MKSRYSIAAVAVVVLHGASASAQGTSTFESRATTLANSCLIAQATAEAAVTTVAACDKVVTDLAALKASTTNPSGHDSNVFSVVTAMAQTRIANTYGKVDGVRSARVCQRVELAWAETSKLDAAASPSYAAMMKDMVDASISATTKCRNEFGTPADAAPLPVG